MSRTTRPFERISRSGLAIALVAFLTAIGAMIPTSSTLAQQWLGLENGRIVITYVPPRYAGNRAVYELLKERRVLEELSAFLSPLRLPRTLHITTADCRTANFFYAPAQGVYLCYELPAAFSRIASGIKIRRGFTRDDMILGSFVALALHEVGHAVFDLLRVPVFGREEDAADQIAAFVMLNFGSNVARRTLTGAAQLFRAIDRPGQAAAFADEHGTPLQRFYNLLCLAYGAQPDTFKHLVAAGTLPDGRAVRCGREYEQVRLAFATTIWPHVDEDLLKKVQTVEWAKWESSKPSIDDLIGDELFRISIALICVAAVVVFATSTSPKDLIAALTRFNRSAFQGRLSRRHWWAYTLTVVAFVMLGYALLGFFDRFELPFVLQVAWVFLEYALYGAFLYWLTILGVKRLHDRDEIGWQVLLLFVPLLVAWIGNLYQGRHPESFNQLKFAGILVWSLIPWFWSVIELGFLRGTRGTNWYGPEDEITSDEARLTSG